MQRFARRSRPLAVVPTEILAALADPTRRQILEHLSLTGPQTATGLAEEFQVSRQAVAKHLGQLKDAGLAGDTRSGRENWFEAKPEGLNQLSTWIERVQGEWSSRLELLAASLSPVEDEDGGQQR